MYYCNARSILPKFDELSAINSLHSPDIICIVESWLSSDICDSELSLPGFSLFRRDRNRHGGGILVYVKSTLSPSIISYNSSSPIELLLISVKPKHSSFTLAVFYRPPSSPNALNTLQTALESLPHSTLLNLVLLGDFNVDYTSPSPALNQILALSDLFSLDQIVSHPTHFSPSGSPSLIDLVFTSPSFSPSSCNILPPISNSDHRAILFCLPASQVPSPSSSSSFRRVWLYESADFSITSNFLSNIPWSSILSSSDVNCAWLTFKFTFLRIIHLTVPSKLVSSPPYPPWITRSFLSRIKKRNSLFQHAKLSNSPLAWSAYRSFRNSTLSYLRSLKAKFFARLSSSPTARQFWSFVKKLRKSSSSIPPLSDSGSLVYSDSSKANLLNDFFCSCFNSSCPVLSSTDPGPTPSFCPSNLLCSQEQVLQLLLNLPTDSASGPDAISSRMLKSTASSIAFPLSHIFNLSLKSGTLPSEWKHSHIVPIPKTKSPSSLPSDYRPISLLPIISKVLERHVYNFIFDFCNRHDIISNCQFGFRPGFSTVSALLSFTHHCYSLFDSRKSVCAIFFDLRKAFDSIPHKLLLDTLSSTGLPPLLIHWLRNYLSNRLQQVVINGQSSRHSLVLSGVPQGSILGPLLFIIYINGLSNIPLSSTAKLILYADDILLSLPCNSPSDISLIQHNIDLISSWISANYLTINSSKTKYMFISPKPSSFFSSFPLLCLNGSSLELVSSYKYLGVLISSNLSWSLHIDSICRKSRQILGLLFRHFYRHSSPSALFKLYIALVRPHLEYCSILWDPSSPSVVNSLEKVQFFTLKLCSKHWSSSYSSLLRKFNCPSLSSRRKISKLIFLFKILHGYVYFPPDSFLIRPPPRIPIRSSHPLNLLIPFARTSALLHSFIPRSSSLWNSLPHSIKDCTSLSTFKNHLYNYYYS